MQALLHPEVVEESPALAEDLVYRYFPDSAAEARTPAAYWMFRMVNTRRPLVEKMITLAKHDTLHTRRQAAAFLETPAAVKKLFDKLGTRFGQRAGGYTRVVRLGFRKGDGAEQAMLELVGSELVKRAAERAKRREERLNALRQGKEEGEAPEDAAAPFSYLTPAECCSLQLAAAHSSLAFLRR